MPRRATLSDVVDHVTSATSVAAACIGKVRYGRRAARRAARTLQDRQGDGVHAYPCPYGSHWHVGHDVPMHLGVDPTDVDVDADRIDQLDHVRSGPTGRRTDRWHAAARTLGLDPAA